MFNKKTHFSSIHPSLLQRFPFVTLAKLSKIFVEFRFVNTAVSDWCWDFIRANIDSSLFDEYDAYQAENISFEILNKSLLRQEMIYSDRLQTRFLRKSFGADMWNVLSAIESLVNWRYLFETFCGESRICEESLEELTAPSCACGLQSL